MEGWWRMSRNHIIFLSLAVMLANSTSAQVPIEQKQKPPPSVKEGPSHSATAPGDIVVEGYRLRGEVQTAVTPNANVSGVESRRIFENSDRLARCAVRSKLSSLVGLRAVVDGDIHHSSQALAQDRLKRTYITCTESTALQSFTTADSSSSVGGVSSDGAPLGYSLYDRGAFIIAAMKMFAPDLKLTKTDTRDAAVQMRFDLREVPRNRFRLPADFHYFEIAVCMVRVQPELSVRLALSDGPARLSDLQAALIDQASICLGNAKRVQADPTEFRIYIADAVYRWAVAARGVDSLIPEG